MCEALGTQEQLQFLKSKVQVLVRQNESLAYPHLMPAVGLWGIYLNSLRLSFPLCKMGITLICIMYQDN